MSTFGNFAGDDILVIADRSSGTMHFASSQIHGVMLAPNNCLSISLLTWNDEDRIHHSINASYSKYIVCLAATEYILIAVNNAAETRLLMLASTTPLKEEWTNREKHEMMKIEKISKLPIPPPSDVWPESALFATVRSLLQLFNSRDNKKHNQSRL
jgi:hypothetical protein